RSSKRVFSSRERSFLQSVDVGSNRFVRREDLHRLRGDDHGGEGAGLGFVSLLRSSGGGTSQRKRYRLEMESDKVHRKCEKRRLFFFAIRAAISPEPLGRKARSPCDFRGPRSSLQKLPRAFR